MAEQTGSMMRCFLGGLWLLVLCVICVLISLPRVAASQTLPTTLPPGNNLLAAIIAGTQEQRSLWQHFSYKMTETSERTADGTKILSDQPGNQLRITSPDRAYVCRTDYARICDGVRESVVTTIYDENLKVKNTTRYAWNGSIGKLLDSTKGTGEIQKDRDLTLYADSAVFDFDTEPVEVWLKRNAADATVKEEPEGRISVSVDAQAGGSFAERDRLIFDRRAGFLLRGYQIYRGSLLTSTMEVRSFQSTHISGSTAFFPSAYCLTMYIVDRKIPAAFKSVPLLRSTALVSGLSQTRTWPDDQFDIVFPNGTSLYDEFSGDVVKVEDTSPLQRAIDDQVKSLKPRSD